MFDSSLTPTPRRRLPFAWLLVVLVVVLLLGGVWWWRSQSIETQVERVGGRIAIHYSEKSAAKRTFENLAGMKSERFHQIWFSYSQLDDNWLRDHRDRLAELENLDLSVAQTAVTNAGLQHLADLTNITRFDVSLTHVTDSGLTHVATMTSLQSLAVAGTQITGDGLQSVLSLPRLQHLQLDKSRITGDDLFELTRLPMLSSVSIDATQASERGVAGLRACSKLDDLTLTDATDDAVARFAHWSALRKLTLIGEGVTDAGVPSIVTLNGLRELFIINSSITDDGEQQLRQALAGCRVQRHTVPGLKTATK